MQQIISKQEARAKGAMFYFTGKPCSNGHIAQRYTSVGVCLACTKDIHAKLRADTAVRKAARPLSPREQAQVDGSKRYDTGQPCRDGHRSERITLNGACIECLRLKREALTTKEKKKIKLKKIDYRNSNPERFRAHARNRRAKLRNAEGTHTKEDVQVLMELQKARCIFCPADIAKSYHVDHRKPLSKGGSNDRRNLQLLCSKCNRRKHNKDEHIFARQMGLLL